MIKVKFLNNFSPRVKGEVVELETKLANYYISLGVAESCKCKKGAKPCSDCEKAKEVIIETVSEAVVGTKKKQPKKKK